MRISREVGTEAVTRTPSPAMQPSLVADRAGRAVWMRPNSGCGTEFVGASGTNLAGEFGGWDYLSRARQVLNLACPGKAFRNRS